ncbi:MAG: ABC-type xylose transport system, permease component [Chloroflexi bacterium AL-W]|nr:ABC-type xylose transport system, permease component [Chloroflexi bacterium AL-N1]NOK67614.1 ABC-type xylose transport system, permease component [Chloroflexi bacterium AL-N10]NOK75616.1 ABC-type xylose transport system, permease component [Chloroflexi bacterium AL-N5]NOK82404.1 ABC-type xylose transport system, permease component [Chloroflexi bacterium AL-W]NOK90249.1 ABC-type xylose transport system, permease component [Chloroflexi bacterium AL-N15]
MSNTSQTQSTTPETDLYNKKSTQTVTKYLSDQLTRIRSGDLGSLPIILGLIAIAIIFQTQNENFLTARNFVNLIVQMAGITTIAIGIVFVLLLGEIDLSVGYVSAVAGVLMTLLLTQPNNWPWFAAIGVALVAAAGIGVLHGVIITSFQVPSFVVTLAGLLAWNGAVLILFDVSDASGSILIQDAVVNGITKTYLPPLWGWLAAAILVIGFAAAELISVYDRGRRGLETKPVPILAIQTVGLALLSGIAVYVANQDRGFPVVGIMLLILLIGFTFLATKTPFGRYVYAVGGNKEAARRAGIKVERVRVLGFMIASFMAGCGGIILASRLSSVDRAAGGGDLLLNSIAAAVIGGTSLFGGRGHVSSALFGALIIASVANGMGLLGLSAGIKFVVTGLVLLAAVLIDSISRRGRT